jgi:sulfur carrier protein
VRLNGEETELEHDTTVDALVERLGLGNQRVAVELNRNVVRRESWSSTVVVENDHVEIVQFVGGG